MSLRIVSRKRKGFLRLLNRKHIPPPDAVLRVSIFPEWKPFKYWSVPSLFGNQGREGRIVWRVERLIVDETDYASCVVRRNFDFDDPEEAMSLFNEWTEHSPDAEREFLFSDKTFDGR